LLGLQLMMLRTVFISEWLILSRVGGDQSYREAVVGLNGGVDLEGSNMNRFIGQLVLPELLVTGKVGVYVDMPADIGPTLA
jgi:hypothetical protein